MIGRTISHYKILEKLGEGGMGVVYKAEDLKLQRLVALKFLAHHSLKDEEAKARFLREARAAAALQHPNICTVHEVDEAEGQTFIAMAYLEGRELTEEISDGPIDTGRVIDIAIQLAEGLREAHDKGTVHRDIKPANVMLTKSGQAVLMDFGLAQLASAGSRLTRDGTTVGTSAYMSPEQMSGEKVDHRTDIWALGVVLYEMAAGSLPFRGEYEQAIQYAIVHEQPEPLSDFAPGVSKEFERVVAKALAKKPVERYQHIEELLGDLRTLRSDSGAVNKPARKGEWSTKKHLFGLPLVHIAWGYDPETGNKRIARGIVAIGEVAVGGIAIGGISLGGIAVGGISVGLASAGGIALALWLAWGAVSVGMQPYGVVAIGPQGTRVIEQASTARLQTEMPSVAVMPFINSSGDADFEYFSDGMTDELINALGKVRGLRVVGRSSVFQFKGERYDAQEVGDRLQVGALLEGAVRKAGDRLRITAQLINAADGFELWSERFDSELKDVFDVQDEICRAMVGALQAELLGDASQQIVRRSTDNPKAYELYLRGWHHYYKLTPAEVEKGRPYFEEAIRLDPNFPLPYVGLGGYYISRDLDKAEAEVAKALEIDDELAFAHTMMGHIKTWQWEWSSAEISTQRAVDLQPSLALAHHNKAVLYFHVGTIDRAIEESRRAIKLDPLDHLSRWRLSYNLFTAGLYEESLREARTTLELAEWHVPYWTLAGVYLRRDRPGEAVQALERALDIAPDDIEFKSYLAGAYAAAGRQSEARQMLGSLLEQRETSFSSAWPIAFVHFALGEDDRAFEWCETAYRERARHLPGGLRWLPRYKGYERLADDPRYHDLLRRMNIPEP